MTLCISCAFSTPFVTCMCCTYGSRLVRLSRFGIIRLGNAKFNCMSGLYKQKSRLLRLPEYDRCRTAWTGTAHFVLLFLSADFTVMCLYLACVPGCRVQAGYSRVSWGASSLWSCTCSVFPVCLAGVHSRAAKGSLSRCLVHPVS